MTAEGRIRGRMPILLPLSAIGKEPFGESRLKRRGPKRGERSPAVTFEWNRIIMIGAIAVVRGMPVKVLLKGSGSFHQGRFTRCIPGNIRGSWTLK